MMRRRYIMMDRHRVPHRQQQRTCWPFTGVIANGGGLADTSGCEVTSADTRKVHSRCPAGNDGAHRGRDRTCTEPDEAPSS